MLQFRFHRQASVKQLKRERKIHHYIFLTLYFFPYDALSFLWPPLTLVGGGSSLLMDEVGSSHYPASLHRYPTGWKGVGKYVLYWCCRRLCWKSWLSTKPPLKVPQWEWESCLITSGLGIEEHAPSSHGLYWYWWEMGSESCYHLMGWYLVSYSGTWFPTQPFLAPLHEVVWGDSLQSGKG